MLRRVISDLPSQIPSLVSKFIKNNPLYQNKTAQSIICTIGAGILLSKVFTVVKELFSILRPSFNLPQRYGQKSWAVITGGSDGIGKAFAFSLAEKGFNIVLVSRNKERLDIVAKALQYKFPTIQTRTIAADFTEAYKEGFAERIYEEVKDLDISILVNNAGGFIKKPYVDISVKELQDIINLNCLSHALITRVFLPGLANREKKSAIINISSIAGGFPQPHRQTYSASKAFLDYLSRGLAYEHTNIDILSVKPAYVYTKMTSFRQPDSGAVTPEELVESSLGLLGKKTHSHGHWKQRIRGCFILGMPNWLRDVYIRNILLTQKISK